MNPTKILKNRVAAGIFIGAIITIILAALSSFTIFRTWHLKIADTLYTRNAPTSEIVIIAIDTKSTNHSMQGGLGKYAQWSRDNYTNLLEVLKNENPKVITFDVIFSTPTQSLPFQDIRTFKYDLDKNATNKEKLEAYESFLNENSSTLENAIDTRLAEKFAEFDNIVLGFVYEGGSPIFPLKKFSENATLGFANAELDADGVLRQSEISFEAETPEQLNNEPGIKIYDSLALATVKKYLEPEAIQIPLENEKMNINYFADPFEYKMISFVDVLNKNFEPDTFKNKIVLIGATDFKSIKDDTVTPRSNKITMPGVEAWANQIQTILEQKFLTNQTTFSKIAVVAIISIGLMIALNFLGIILSIAVAITAIILYILAAHFLYYHGIILNMVYPFLAIILSYLASWVYKFFIADKKKREIKSAFGHYLSKELVEQISKNPDILKLGGETKEITVFFSDIKNSTTISESTPTEKWVAQINEYFTAMEKIIKDSGGTLDKYEGDAIMGFWNAPLPQGDHIERAYNTALAMQKELQNLNEKWGMEGRPQLEIRIGINTGEAIVGNFGSLDRFDYTVMGDTVNTASRLESFACKKFMARIIVSAADEKIAAIKGKYNLEELESLILPGKKTAVKTYKLTS